MSALGQVIGKMPQSVFSDRLIDIFSLANRSICG
jgi:hypothetical protein